jgi:hypothetical protein
LLVENLKECECKGERASAAKANVPAAKANAHRWQRRTRIGGEAARRTRLASEQEELKPAPRGQGEDGAIAVYYYLSARSTSKSSAVKP